jgi:hypothetical protein
MTCAAAARPTGPAPMMATFLSISFSYDSRIIE